MKPEEVRVSKEARKLLAELVELHDKYMEQTATLADRNTPYPDAVHVGAERESMKRIIAGCAFRLSEEVRAQSVRQAVRA